LPAIVASNANLGGAKFRIEETVTECCDIVNDGSQYGGNSLSVNSCVRQSLAYPGGDRLGLISFAAA
jgi:hypothetical protein